MRVVVLAQASAAQQEFVMLQIALGQAQHTIILLSKIF
jgi:hypothetical protein